YETIEFEIKEHVALITLNREEAANALNVQMAEELMDAAIRCDTEISVRAVLITARGKMFCAGGDLKVFSETESIKRSCSYFFIEHFHK
ncbi:MAG: enoyl-CoA hydratase/isomerase family protein, partial [SAR324 cluster bacterium]|nr:enoyl-CoA hydratase/isomerase family protein [SAR324 cluster bacterium]